MKHIIITALLGMFATATLLAAEPVNMTITLKNGQVVAYRAAELDSITYVGGQFGENGALGMKLYPAGQTVSHDYAYSQIESIVTGVDVTAPVITPNGGAITGATSVTIAAAAGTTIYYTLDGSDPTYSDTRQSGPSPVRLSINFACTIRAVSAFGEQVSEESSATFTISDVYDANANRNKEAEILRNPEAWRIEFPHLSNNGTCEWVTKYCDDMITFSLEWDDNLIANRWTCYQMYDKIMETNVDRKDDFKEDPDLNESTRSTLEDYSGSGYSRGHLCPSADRLYSREQNKQTFFLSNMQPQWQSHNGGIWSVFEEKVRTWASQCDTLYVVKAATIDDVTIDGATNSGVFDYKCNNRLPVPKYFYMALLKYNKTTNSYSAIGIWTIHQNATESDRSVASHAISIDELERRVGIDFFCNLPDEVETTVESEYNLADWQ